MGNSIRCQAPASLLSASLLRASLLRASLLRASLLLASPLLASTLLVPPPALAWEDADPQGLQEPDAVEDADDIFDDGLDDLLGGGSGDGDAGRSWTLQGFLAVEPRVYLQDRNGEKNDEQLIVEGDLELDWQLGKRWSLYLRPRLFVDLLDDDLHRFEPFEAYLAFEGDGWDMRLGQMVENWGIVDTFNPVDVINRRDLATDILDPDRLGELGLRLRRLMSGNKTFGEPTLSVYALPVFRPTRYGTVDQRFGPAREGFPFDEDGGFEPTGSEEGLYAVRWQSTLSTAPLNADLQGLVARGPERSPSFVGEIDGGGAGPIYFGARTYGAGLRAVPNEDVLGAFLASLTLKVEVVYKSHYAFEDSPIPSPDDYLAYVVGFDRGFYNVFKGQDQLTLTLEVAGEDGADDAVSLLRPFRDDVIVRCFWEANDFARTSVELRGIYDLDTSERLAELVFGTQLRRLHEDLRWSLQVQWFDPPRTGESFFDVFPDNSSVSTVLRWDF